MFSLPGLQFYGLQYFFVSLTQAGRGHLAIAVQYGAAAAAQVLDRQR